MNKEICGMTFRTKQSLENHIRGIVASYKDGEHLNPEDREFMTEVLQGHRDPIRKIGIGIKSMCVKRNYPFPSRGFWIERLDGTEVEFSWVSCLKQKTHKDDVINALRDAIRDQVVDFRKRFFAGHQNPECPLTGEALSPETCHVDHHDPTFDQLASGFLNDRDMAAIQVGGFEDGAVLNYLIDEDLCKSWQEYHRENATLRVLSRTGNLSQAKLLKR